MPKPNFPSSLLFREPRLSLPVCHPHCMQITHPLGQYYFLFVRFSLENLPVVSQFDPNNLLVVQLLAGFAVVAAPAALRQVYAQAFWVEGRRARLAAQQLPAWKQTDDLRTEKEGKEEGIF